MENSFKVIRIWNIPIGVHPTWFLIFGLFTFSLATSLMPTEYPQLSSGMHWALGLATSLVFFLSVLAHELGHAYLALRNKVPVKGISLFFFGGVAQITEEPRTPGMEFKIAIAGPLVSLALALFFQLTYLLDAQIPFLAAPSEYLARINLMLALFNMIPGFPLDGGRVLRSIVWKVSGDFKRSTWIAARVGQLVAFGFIGFGIYSALTAGLVNGLWLGFIGWFLLNAASSAYMQTTLQNKLEGVTVAQVMQRNYPIVPGNMTLDRLVQEQVMTQGQQVFVVNGFEPDRRSGILTLNDIKRQPAQKWRFLTTEQAMVPWECLAQVSPDTPLLEALKKMEESGLIQVPVVNGSRVEGLVSREQVLNYLRLRTELGA
jgi:Zn-dependent protease